MKIKTAAAKPPQNETLNTTMFPELFLERLSYLCEISGRECMQAFCSAWTPNTHHIARLNVIICSEREIHCKANYATLQCILTPRREKCQGNGFFPPNTPDPQQWTTRLQEKPTARLPAAAKYDHRREKSVSEEEGALCGLVAPIRAVAVVCRTAGRGSALGNIYLFLEAVLFSIHVCWGMNLRFCVIGKSGCKMELLQFAAFPMVGWRRIPMGVPEFHEIMSKGISATWSVLCSCALSICGFIP